MINRAALLTDLQALLKRLEADLLERSESDDVPDVGQTLRAEYKRAKEAERTAQNYEDWRSGTITQAAAAWVLSCVFVRFLEDNQLIDPPKIAGVVTSHSSLVTGHSQNRLQAARDEHELYFQAHPTETDREYLLGVFDELRQFPACRDIFDPAQYTVSGLVTGQKTNDKGPMTNDQINWLSGDAAGEMLRFFQKIDANTGDLVHDFTDHDWDTRFLGDLYQDLSEAARKKYALLQTPDFVEEFILDRTLDPAIEEFGLEGFKMIDPACGSGHFLLGAFRRIEARWEKHDPDAKLREVVQRTLDSIFGVDVNPFAVAIARFRLLLAALRTCGVMKLTKSPAFHVNLACGDSLYHGRQRQQMLGDDWTDEAHYFIAEDAPALRRMLREGTYHCVVANPPYITPKDRAASQAYRKLYPKTCHMKYSLAAPFMERIYRLAVPGGFTGQITANSFMKREFGKKLIEEFLPKVDLTHVIDTSGAYIPGHGTPTVILFGRNRKAVTDTIRTVMGIRGEPSTPDDPSRALVWSAVVEQIDDPGSQSEFVSVDDSQRELFHKHPWSIGGGGAAELKEQLDNSGQAPLRTLADEIGVLGMTNADDVMLAPTKAFCRRRVEPHVVRRLALGDELRDWVISDRDASLFPYCDGKLISIDELPCMERWLWRARTVLGNRATFARLTYFQEGRPWWEWHQITLHRLRTPLSIVYSEVATHNHFVLAHGDKVFKQTAPIIKLPTEATEDDHLALLGLLNSSTAAFWLKQVCHNKGSTVDQHGARQRTDAFEDFYQYNATKLQQFPLPEGRALVLVRRLDELARRLQATMPGVAVSDPPSAVSRPGEDKPESQSLIAERLSAARDRYQRIRGLMIFLQEELDWACYRLYALIDKDLTYAGEPFPLAFGERSFEILLARSVARQALPPTTWFDRHNAQPLTAPPEHWPEDYVALYHRRHDIQQKNPNIGLIEQPEYKRRWNTEPWEAQVERTLQKWLLDRLESYFDFDGRMNDEAKPTTKLDISLTTVAALADIARQDGQFMEVGEVYRDDPAFDVQRLVEELVQAENVPLLPVLRYKPGGLRKRQEWERTWELQRGEDLIDARSALSKDDPQYLTEDQASDLKQREIGDIPVPPKYKSADFISSGGARYWALRGKLDVPKERWVSFPHCEGPDGTLVIAWAGYDHLQLARAISEYYVDIQERLGGRDDPRLVPLLACIIELLPWLKQWHHDIDPDFNQRMDEVFEGFVTEEAKALNMTIDEVKAWQPPKKAGRKKKSQ